MAGEPAFINMAVLAGLTGGRDDEKGSGGDAEGCFFKSLYEI